MRDVMIKNICKISFLNNKIEIIDKLIRDRNYTEAYKATAALIELVCILLLERQYNEKIENSNIINLIKLLNNRENKIEQILIEVNGEYNQINYNKVKRNDVEFLVGYLDEIVGIIIEEHGNIF